MLCPGSLIAILMFFWQYILVVMLLCIILSLIFQNVYWLPSNHWARYYTYFMLCLLFPYIWFQINPKRKFTLYSFRHGKIKSYSRISVKITCKLYPIGQPWDGREAEANIAISIYLYSSVIIKLISSLLCDSGPNN